MIYELMRDLEQKLQARKFPISWEYGPTRVPRPLHLPSIVVERDRESTDLLLATRGARGTGTGHRHGAVACACVLDIFAQSAGLQGPRVNEHEDICEQIRDQVLVALDEWASEHRAIDIPIAEMRYVSAKDWNFVEAWPGVQYRIRFRVPRGLVPADFDGALLPTGAAAGVGNEVHVLHPAPQEPEIVPLP